MIHDDSADVVTVISIYIHYMLFLSIFTLPSPCFFFFFNDTATTEIYTLSLHDALPISPFLRLTWRRSRFAMGHCLVIGMSAQRQPRQWRSEEHTSELQSRPHLVCRLLLEKKKKITLRDRRAEQ